MKKTSCWTKDCDQDHFNWQYHTPRYLLISLLDWLDDHIVGHRSFWLCQAIGNSPWWNAPTDNEETPGDDQTLCPGCGEPMGYHDAEGFCL